MFKNNIRTIVVLIVGKTCWLVRRSERGGEDGILKKSNYFIGVTIEIK